MKEAGSPRLKFWEVIFCFWIVATQVWYYLQFKQQFSSVLAPILRKLWR